MKTAEQKANVFYNGILAGTLVKSEDGYVFTYDDNYFLKNDNPAISLSFPKNSKVYNSKYLFPFFFGLLSEGHLRLMKKIILHG
ncbi:MAG: HipA N-terminal domain-containing protein [Ignavibacteria bacterium]|nr:HipA N-terminal domain-containing protein [Ignavibacteria bacterium]